MSTPTDISSAPRHASINDCWNQIGVRGDASCPELKQHIDCRNCPVYAAAAAVLLDGELPAGYLAEWTTHFAREQQTTETETHSVVIFRIGAEWLALPTAVFTEVAPLRTIHSLPHRRSGAVAGLANVRGELVVCVALDHILGLEKTAETKRGKQRREYQRLLVISREGSRVVFPVDEVHGVHRYHPHDLKAVPATVGKAAATYTKAMLAWKDHAVGCLDEALLFHVLNRSLA